MNQGQYRLIFEDNVVNDKVNEINETHKLYEYPLKFDDPFFKNGEFFSKQDKLIKAFLTGSEKVAISSTMILIPFFCKGIYYYLTIDNLTEQISIDSVNTAFKHINKQSNLYYQIITAIPKELRDEYAEFEHNLLKDIRKATGKNNKLLKQFYKDKPKRLVESKYIYKVE
ncbi:hypothetical protein GCM10025860_08380 [Methanobacterium ferruginis]|nr:hypothetical protein GCM10025860_08380 [Methanobacterium ferruginis]